MGDQFSIILLAAGPGAIVGLLALGLIITYRSSNVLNLATPAMATLGGFVFAELAKVEGVPTGVWVVVAAAVIGLISALIYWVVMRPLRNASPLTRLVATIAITQIILSLLFWRYGDQFYLPPAVVPQGTVEFVGGATVGLDRMVLLWIAIILTAILWAVYKFTRFGVATSAIAESPFMASIFGLGMNKLALANWFLAGALAGAAGAVLAPVNGLNLSQLSGLLVPVLTAAIIGYMTSFPLALVGAIGISIIQAESAAYSTNPGTGDVLTFIVLVVVLMWRRGALPIRNFQLPRLPAIGSGKIRWIAATIVIAVVAVSIYSWLPTEYYRPLLVNLCFIMIILSIVVITGYAGQLSLAQMAFAGLGAYSAAHFAAASGLPFILVFAVGVAIAIVVGGLAALPSIRLSGVNLAVVTLGFAVAMYTVLFIREEQVSVESPTFFGIDLNMISSPRNYLAFGLAAVAVCLFIVANLRRSRSGIRMIAVRGNERAAAALGINANWIKIQAFAIGAGLAAAGGILLAFQSQAISLEPFAPIESLNVVANGTIGGTGFLMGPVVGSNLVPGNVVTAIVDNFYSNTAIIGVIGGVLLLDVLLRYKDGFVGLFRKRKAVEADGSLNEPPAPTRSNDVAFGGSDNAATDRGRTLEIRGVSVSFGAVLALSDVSLTVAPGTVHGLIGSNGSGKTTLLDVISGFTSTKAGTVRLGEEDLTGLPAWRRARIGLGRSFQNVQLFPDLPVIDNLKVACSAHGGSVVRDMIAPVSMEVSLTASEAIATLELERYLDSSVDDLSHGKRQLVSIARALATAPSFVLLDEPAAGLDDSERNELGALLRHIAVDRHIGILLVEHDVDLVLEACDRVTVLHQGHVLAEGTPQEIRDSAEVRDAYLGEDMTESGTPILAKEES